MKQYRYLVVDADRHIARLVLPQAIEYELTPAMRDAALHIEQIPQGIILKALPGAVSPMSKVGYSHYPVARPVLGRTPFGVKHYGDNAAIWRIGYQAENGFCIPPRDILARLYIPYDGKWSSYVSPATADFTQSSIFVD